ncbi:hypothetical protein [Streptomyces sp. NPDC088812]|uniref:hypothetical protein n=1 Tax=Streptomyces sp. NPDC088812 TaxID=3365905 RepID=UPI0037F71084
MATVVGVAAATLDRVVSAAAGGKRTASPLYPVVAEAPSHQANVAEAAVLVDTARLHLRRAADEVDTQARAGRRPALADRARLRMDAPHSARCAHRAVSLLLDTAGAGGE